MSAVPSPLEAECQSLLFNPPEESYKNKNNESKEREKRGHSHHSHHSHRASSSDLFRQTGSLGFGFEKNKAQPSLRNLSSLMGESLFKSMGAKQKGVFTALFSHAQRLEAALAEREQEINRLMFLNKYHFKIQEKKDRMYTKIVEQNRGMVEKNKGNKRHRRGQAEWASSNLEVSARSPWKKEYQKENPISAFDFQSPGLPPSKSYTSQKTQSFRLKKFGTSQFNLLSARNTVYSNSTQNGFLNPQSLKIPLQTKNSIRSVAGSRNEPFEGREVMSLFNEVDLKYLLTNSSLILYSSSRIRRKNS